MPTNILFPVEIINRDKDYKLIMAAMVAKEVGSAIVAQHDLCDKIINKTTSGVYIGKNIVDQTGKHGCCDKYKIAKNNDYSIVHIDDEGGIYPGEQCAWEFTLQERLDPNVLDKDDWVITWGNFQKKYYESLVKKQSAVKITALGYPKFDLYKGYYKSFVFRKRNSIKDKPYILINTHFTMANSSMGLSSVFSTDFWYGPSQESMLFCTKQYEADTASVARVINLVHILSFSFPDTDIIIRPHPSESNEFYEVVTKALNNVQVVHDGAVGESIVNALVVIHEKCTTAIEASFLGIPVIQFNKDKTKSCAEMLQSVGVQCFTYEDVVAEIKHIMNKNNASDSVSYSNIDRAMIENLSTNNITTIINGIVTLAKKKHTSSRRTLVSLRSLVFNEFIYEFVSLIKNPIRRLFFRDKHRQYLGYKRCFYGFNKKEIKKDVAIISELLSCEFKVKVVGKRLIYLKKC